MRYFFNEINATKNTFTVVVTTSRSAAVCIGLNHSGVVTVFPTAKACNITSVTNIITHISIILLEDTEKLRGLCRWPNKYVVYRG